jgi:putative transposase
MRGDDCGVIGSFPVAQDDHFLRVCRYVERNAARAGLVRRAQVWRWCSLWQRAQEPRPEKWLLSAWPVVVAEADWVREVNGPQTEADLEALRRSVQRGQPYGEELWAERVARRLGLASTLRPRGRPRKALADKGS